ncbi:adenosylcobinamide-GDP ribazoletransferase [uncultured Akkermansia sp.]|uniref:adenosylcobinamide-GDP ribazoletransferase n=1 Tax=uncultured Akkermansia sp. TaxID=512294 RepID=UPI0025E41C5D|nr:adenosylcobinamide-GDP ribazoletransferase [uncultured Akkermansia sp.]
MAVITTIRSAFGFLTRLPVGPWPLQNDLNGISAWLPLVGLAVGGLAGGLTWAAPPLLPPPGAPPPRPDEARPGGLPSRPSR